MNEYLSHEEIQAAKEEKDTQANDLDPTSDNKKDNIASSQIQPTIQAPSDRALGKRRRIVVSEPGNEDFLEVDDDNDDVNLPLPDTQNRMSAEALYLTASLATIQYNICY